VSPVREHQPCLPSAGAPSGLQHEKHFTYRAGEWVLLERNPEEEWQRRLRMKAFKVSAWSDKLEEYRQQGYKFVPVCLTFKDMNAYIEFEKRGGRREFLKQYKRVCEAHGAHIVDFACVVEFQERGVPHLHYLFVAKGRLPFPDQVKTVYEGLGMSHVGRAFRQVKKGVRYLSQYLRKMKQLSLEAYQQVVALLQAHGIKERLRLYELGRPDKRGMFSALSKGWIRWLYVRLLRHRKDWSFRKGWLWLRDLLGVKADWGVYSVDDSLYLTFRGFQLTYLHEGKAYEFWVDSLDDLVAGIEKWLEQAPP